MDALPEATAAALRKLSAFLGTWATIGEVVATSARFTAEDSYEWLPGGFFMLHRWDAAMPEGRSQGIEDIGYEGGNDRYTMHSFDSQGNATLMHCQLRGRDIAVDGESVRFRGSFSRDRKAIKGEWSLKNPDAGEWQAWMSVKLVRSQ